MTSSYEADNHILNYEALIQHNAKASVLGLGAERYICSLIQRQYFTQIDRTG